MARLVPKTFLITILCLCFNWSSAFGASFSDDFSTDTRSYYTFVDTWTLGGNGQLNWIPAGQLEFLTGDNVASELSRSLPASNSGQFQIDFLPTTKYPAGGKFILRLVQDANNYYEVKNTDGYGVQPAKKVTGGVLRESVSFGSVYTQGNNYQIKVTFNPTTTTVEAFGSVLTLSANGDSITVNRFEIALVQQDAFLDNIVYSTNASNPQDPTSTISDPANGATLSGSSADPYIINGSASDDVSVTGVEVSIDGGAWTAATCTGCPDANVIWSYSWTLPADGSYTIQSRATDNDTNVETPGSGNTVTLDRTGPSVSTTIPANGDVDVTLNNAVTVNWNESVDCATVNTSSVTINPAVSWTRTSCSGSQAIFTPSGQATSTPYTVTVGIAITDTAGNPMTVNHPFSYTTTDQAASYSDDFSTDTRLGYNFVDTWTLGGNGQLNWIPAGQLEFLTGDNVASKLSRSLPASNSGQFQIDFLPTTKYPTGGKFILRLVQDANNYYEVKNTDGYGVQSAKKVTGGVLRDSASFGSVYTQGNNYQIKVTFNPTTTTVEAFGSVLTLSANSDSITVNRFEIELVQQDAFLDNLVYTGGAADTTPPVWDTTVGIGSATDTTSGGSVTVEFDTATDAVDGSNVKYNVYYAQTTLWSDSNWSSNSSMLDVTPVAGSTYINAFTVPGLTNGVQYTFGVRVADQSNNEDTNPNTAVATPSGGGGGPAFSDDFSTDTRSYYTFVDTWTLGGNGQLNWIPAGQLEFLTGDNVASKLSRSLPASNSGQFQIDFLPTAKYPATGKFRIRLVQDGNNYYELKNTDGDGPGKLKKYIGGSIVDSANFNFEFSQNNNYHIEIAFTPSGVMVDAFGESLIINNNATAINVNVFEIILTQQDAYLDNIVYSNSPFVKIYEPENLYLQSGADLQVKAIGHLGTGTKILFIIDSGTPEETSDEASTAPFEVIFPNLLSQDHTVDALVADAANNQIPGDDTFDQKINVATGGDCYVAMGDSITFGGTHDDFPSDDTSNDLRNTGGGYTPILNNLLTGIKGYPHDIKNEGVNGALSVDGKNVIDQLIAKYPQADRYLVMYGANDAGTLPAVPSGEFLSVGHPNYPGTYKANLQYIIDRVNAAGAEVALGEVLVQLADCSSCPWYPDPPSTGARNVIVSGYNRVQIELKAIPGNNISINPPGFFSYFDTNYATEYDDWLHPNGVGFQSMAGLWRDEL